MATTTAMDMANQGGMRPEKFRDALRKEHFAWHEHNDRWTVEIDSVEHEEMKRVLRKMSN